MITYDTIPLMTENDDAMAGLWWNNRKMGNWYLEDLWFTLDGEVMQAWFLEW